MRRKREVVIALLLIVVMVMGSIAVIGCGSPREESSATLSPGGRPAGLPSEFIAKAVEILGITQQELESALNQAWSEMMKNRKQNSPPRGVGGKPPILKPPEDRSSMHGLPQELVNRIAEILAIEAQKVADAFAQLQAEMGENIPRPRRPSVAGNFSPCERPT